LRVAEFLFESRLPPDTEYTFKHAMTQEAAYASVLREQRRNLHVELVRAIEALYEGRLAEQVDRLAEHALAGELWPEATHYLLRAANRAIERSAHVQAADLLQRGLDAMQHLPDTQDRLRIELGYLKALGVTMMALRGWGAQEVSDAYTRARPICEQLDDQQELFVALRGQGQFHMIRGELHTAHELGRQCTAIAQARDNVGVRLETHHLFWSTSFFMGNVAEAEEHAARGMMMYRQDRDHRLTYMYSGHDPGVCCQCFSGLMLWQRGYPHKAVARCQSAFTLAEQIGHPLTLALAQWAMSYVHLFRNEAAEAALWAEREIALCQEYQLPLLLSQGAFQLGWALAEQGDPEAGIARMQEGLFGVTSTGAEMGLPYLIALLGEAQAKAGRPDVGLTEIERALAMARTNGGSFQAAEVFRLKGELLLLRHGRGMRSEAEACFREAVAIARGQGVRLPELRALAGLVRLKGKASGLDDERRELATACAALEEVQDLRDVQEAQALLRA
jgi:tetratricopeptide (TPR) repeat protein